MPPLFVHLHSDSDFDFGGVLYMSDLGSLVTMMFHVVLNLFTFMFVLAVLILTFCIPLYILLHDDNDGGFQQGHCTTGY